LFAKRSTLCTWESNGSDEGVEVGTFHPPVFFRAVSCEFSAASAPMVGDSDTNTSLHAALISTRTLDIFFCHATAIEGRGTRAEEKPAHLVKRPDKCDRIFFEIYIVICFNNF
jgi:hypothetical protein